MDNDAVMRAWRDVFLSCPFRQTPLTLGRGGEGEFRVVLTGSATAGQRPTRPVTERTVTEYLSGLLAQPKIPNGSRAVLQAALAEDWRKTKDLALFASATV